MSNPDHRDWRADGLARSGYTVAHVRRGAIRDTYLSPDAPIICVTIDAKPTNVLLGLTERGALDMIYRLSEHLIALRAHTDSNEHTRRDAG